MPTITENIKLKQYFLDHLTDMYAKKTRKGVHISDLVYCIRESYLRKYLNKPQNLSSLFFFLDGEQRHKGFQGLVPNLQNEKKVKKFGIEATMDLYNDTEEELSKVIEIKTTRAKPKGEIPPHYMRQGAYYCLVRETDHFTLMTQHVNHTDIVFMDVYFTKGELENYYKEMITDYNTLIQAFHITDMDIRVHKSKPYLDIIKEDMMFVPMVRESMKWKCALCLYHEECFGNNVEVKKPL